MTKVYVQPASAIEAALVDVLFVYGIHPVAHHEDQRVCYEWSEPSHWRAVRGGTFKMALKLAIEPWKATSVEA